MQKVNGERYVYRFVCDPDALFNMAYGHLSATTAATSSKTEHGHILPTSVASSATLSATKNVTASSIEHETQRERNINSGKTLEPLFYSNSLQKF